MRNNSSSAIKKADTDINTGIQFGADLLQEASGGRALQGIYFTGELKDVLAERENLIAVPKNISRALARAQLMNSLSANVLEMELSELSRKGLCVFMPTSGQPRGQGTQQASTLQRTELYFDEKDLCLSKDALTCLKHIANELKSLSKEEKIKQFAFFFERFGSHAVAGHIIVERHNLGGTSTQGVNELSTVKPMDRKKNTVLPSEQYSEGKKEDEKKTTTIKKEKTEKGDASAVGDDVETVQNDGHNKKYETVNKEQCGKFKNTNQQNTDNDFQCENASEIKFSKTKKTDNERHEPVNDSTDYDIVGEEEINTQEGTREALNAPQKGCYLVPVWTLIKLAGEESFPNPDQLAAELKCAYEAVIGQQPDKPIVEDVKALTEMATSALSAMRNTCADQTPVGWDALINLNKYLRALTKETSPWLTLPYTSVTSLLSLLFLCSTQAACFVPTTENSNSIDEKRRTVSQLIVESREAQADMSAAASALVSAVAAATRAQAALYASAADADADAARTACAVSRSTASALTAALATKAAADRAAIASAVGIPDATAASNAVVAQAPQPHDKSITKVNDTVDGLLLRLGLMDYFPKGLDRSQFHAVRFGITSKGEDQDVPPNKLVSQFMHMLRIADSNIRHLGYLEDTDDTEITAESEGPVHPVDLLLAVFLCADDLMRQHMFLRLSAAQVALPFVIPMPHSAGLEMPLWSFRVVLKSVLSSTTQGKQSLREMSVCDAKFPIVCFVRYGQFVLSKSRIANFVLNERKNVMFFDRECRNNVESRVLMNGLAEIYWYSPSGKNKDDRFSAFVASVNLRGDAFEHRQLAAYLHDIASVNVIFCSKANYEKMNADMTGGLKGKSLIWVSPDMSPSNEEQEKVIKCKNNYDASTVNKIRECIKKGLEDPVKKCSLSEFAEHGQQKHGINVDDGCEECIKAKKYANDIIKLVDGVNPEKAKEELLPLSNNLWKSWCKEDMESVQLNVKPGVGIEQYESEIERRKGSIRQTQTEIIPKSVFLNAFIGRLRSLTPKGRLFLLRWLEMRLNAYSGERLAKLRAKWAELDTRIHQLRRNKESNAVAHIKTLSKELDDLSQKINACTFGLEHCLREVAQMYEAMRSQGCVDCNDLPRIAAALLKDGEPLELMDGDACHVPLDWVEAVLKELHTMVKGKKVFVLSVLGIQSSGKSTLLNTMFGLRFAVSAGRCTRGAFMQLVEIAEEDTGELGYDYVLVIDTEGLRSQELSDECSLRRDNKMASIVIGLANRTMINVYGESVSELKDFLQIAVHTFLHNREVKLAPSCLFVHQNISAPDAEDKTMGARRNLRNQLDEMTAEACKQEGLPVQRFGDVIKNDSRSYCFPSLFMGDPPMAPLNLSYSTKACEVRNAILKGARGQGVLSISDFRARVRDLWMALRGENFVFRFKNTVEVRAYRKLETKCIELDRNMRHGFVDLLEKLRNEARRGDLRTVSAREIKQDDDVSQLLQRARQDCEKFFKDDEDKDTLGQWRERAIIHLENYFDERVEEAVREANNYIEVKERKKEVERTVEKYEKEIIEKTKELAQKNKGIVNKIKGRKLFNDMFEKYLEVVEKSTPEPCRVEVRHDARASLRAHFYDMSDVESKVKQIGKTGKFVVDASKHLTANRVPSTSVLCDNNDGAKLHIECKYEDLVQMVMAYIDDQRESDYSKGWFETIINMVLNEVKRINSTPTGKMFELRKEFCFDALLHIFGLSVTRFKKMHEDFERINNPVNILREKHDDLYQYFTTAYGDAAAMVLFSNRMSQNIMGGYMGRILNKIFLDIAKGTTLVPAFNGNKSNVEAHVLKDLINQEYFEDLMLYVRNPKEYYRRFISSRVNDYCGTGESSRLHKIIKAAVDHYHEEVTKCMKESTEEVRGARGNVNAWLDALHRRIGDYVPFAARELKRAVTEEIQSKVEPFQNEMLTAWDNVDKKSFTDNIYHKARVSIVYRVVEDVLKDKCGCLEHCPFCKAVCCCTLAGHDGDHSVLLHRPQAIGGRRWKETNEANLEICSTLVKSECSFNAISYVGEQWFKYKYYKTAGPPYNTWSITPNDSSQKYWRWIVCRFSKELETQWDYKFEGQGKIPDEWKKITKEEAIASIT